MNTDLIQYQFSLPTSFLDVRPFLVANPFAECLVTGVGREPSYTDNKIALEDPRGQKHADQSQRKAGAQVLTSLVYHQKRSKWSGSSIPGERTRSDGRCPVSMSVVEHFKRSPQTCNLDESFEDISFNAIWTEVIPHVLLPSWSSGSESLGWRITAGGSKVLEHSY